MFLSKIMIPPRVCYDYELFDDYKIHQFVKSLFPTLTDRYLYYVDRSVNGILSVLIQSEVEPGMCPIGEITVKVVPDNFYDRTNYLFRVRISPIKQNQGKARVLYQEEEQIRWFCKKSEKYGIEIDYNSLSVVCNGIIKSRQSKNDNMITIHYVDFVGLLRVVNRNLFINYAVKGGIGRAKAFGCGLLQLNPMKE